VPLFSPQWPGAALLQPGDRVSFEPVDAAAFAEIEKRWRDDPSPPLEYQVAAP
jgi:allophanate hydrolase subunit 1